jgi:uncharacterized membrane protein
LNALLATVDGWVERVARSRRTDPMVDRLRAALDDVPERVLAPLRGDWMGIPLHPVLTDVTIGAWTGAFVADLVGGRNARPFARRLLLLGNAAALPTIATGLADWKTLDRASRRVGVVHAATNLTATLLYVRSSGTRRRGHHAAGVVWGLAGATVATVGAHLGGLLVFRFAGGSDPPDTPDVPDAPDDQRRGREPAPSFAPESLRIG